MMMIFHSRRRLAFSAILIFAALLRISVALIFTNIHYPDEIFQSLEPAHRLAYGYGIVTWEWQDGIRCWVLPGILAAAMHLTEPALPPGSPYRERQCWDTLCLYKRPGACRE